MVIYNNSDEYSLLETCSVVDVVEKAFQFRALNVNKEFYKDLPSKIKGGVIATLTFVASVTEDQDLSIVLLSLVKQCRSLGRNTLHSDAQMMTQRPLMSTYVE